MHAAGKLARPAWSPGAGPVVIRVPMRTQERVGTVKQVRRGGPVVATARPGRLLIKCKNPRFDQSVRYTLGRFEEPGLASKGWKSSRSFGDYFDINSTQTTPPFFPESGSESRGARTFSSLNLCTELVTCLQARGLTHPTAVQTRTIPKLLQGHNVVCAAETGSGKTLAYLLPVVQRLHGGAGPGGANGIRAAVLVPSRELAEQVAGVAEVTGRPLGLKVGAMGGGRGPAGIKAAFRRGPPDVLVATPGALLKALRRRLADLDGLEFLVVDEADTMFDASFAGPLGEILARTRVSARVGEVEGGAQLAVVGATFPGGLGELLSKVTDLGTLVSLRSPNLHSLMPHVKQTFLKVRGSGKVLELHQALKEVGGGAGASGALVFCNSASTVNWLGYALEEMGLRHVRLQGEMPASMREGIFRSFQKGHVDVMVCTDIASRGLDTQRVGLVVNYDFPGSYADYIHRAGRVGRAGGPGGGRVVSFVTHLWDVELVQGIETAARRRTCLPGLEKEIKAPKAKTLTQDGKR